MGSSEAAEAEIEKRLNMHCEYGLASSRKACAQQAKTLQAYRALEEEDVSPASAQSLQGRIR